MDEWIPISERLPDELVEVLYYYDRTEYDKGYAVGYYKKAGEYFTIDSDYVIDIHDVKAWMPLPKPYDCGKLKR